MGERPKLSPSPLSRKRGPRAPTSVINMVSIPDNRLTFPSSATKTADTDERTKQRVKTLSVYSNSKPIFKQSQTRGAYVEFRRALTRISVCVCADIKIKNTTHVRNTNSNRREKSSAHVTHRNKRLPSHALINQRKYFGVGRRLFIQIFVICSSRFRANERNNAAVLSSREIIAWDSLLPEKHFTPSLAHRSPSPRVPFRARGIRITDGSLLRLNRSV